MNELLRRALGLPPQASSDARSIDLLHYSVIGAAFVVAFLAFAIAGLFLVRYRERPGAAARRRPQPPRWIEGGLIAGTLTAFLAWWVVGFSQYRELRAAPDDALRIHVVGKEWMWEYVYPDGATADTDLRVPLGRPVELVLTSRDVIHSFYVPAFRLKEDAVPGRVTTMWFTATRPGTYDVLCAEYCGAGHSRMRGRVIVLPPDDYARWSGARPAADLASTGKDLAVRHGCLRCHTVDGTPHLAPSFRGLYHSEVVLSDGRRVVADEAYLTESMMDPQAALVAGFPPIMPSYQGELGGPDAAAIVEYLRSLRTP
ncbi:MAG TPA: cytochrome c oxidase subunit II [Kofleriaceae bacterium]|nr:cytochrome c oxidase subunit II [Kofleriaceae bacterium]